VTGNSGKKFPCKNNCESEDRPPISGGIDFSSLSLTSSIRREGKDPIQGGRVSS
jgi:hypothetical protein